jgi:hypothetical protein
MSIPFHLSDNSVSLDELDALARRFTRDAADEGISVVPIRAQDASGSGSGQRGDPFTIGTFALALVTSGSVVALFKLLKSYVDRAEELTIELTRKNKTKVKLKMKNVELEKFEAVLKEIDRENA